MIKKLLILSLISILFQDAVGQGWQAQWISAPEVQNEANTWLAFRKIVTLEEVPSKAIAKIAVDSKYWLWINGEVVLREGGLKRGPTPVDTYYDEVDLTKHLKKGRNVIAVLLQYFGKDGFSHNNSGQAGLLFDLQTEDFKILSNSTWKSWLHPAFGETKAPFPNYRLPESNKHFDARKGDFTFTQLDYPTGDLPNAIELGLPSIGPWNNLVKRPIPHWKDFGLQSYTNLMDFPLESSGDTLILKLPYNAQVVPYFEIEAEAGRIIGIRTDQYYGGGSPNIRTEYITKDGRQCFEDFGWISGNEVHYYFPEGIKILDLKYRETGYNTEFAGSFKSSDPFYNELWRKSLRTLYINMRDTYMDTPDRERAQWWGDVVLQSGQSFYALDRKSDALTKKGIRELLNWQRPDNTIFAPVPAGNWKKELPGQMLSSVGYYGIYNYYLNTGDLETMEFAYEPIKDYLNTWEFKENGTVITPVKSKTVWVWGDWGKNKDIALIMNTQYQLAQKGLLKIAEALGKQEEVARIKEEMAFFKIVFNKNFWKGDHYRSEDYDGKKDDRSQALAVLAGLADQDKYEVIYEVLKTERHASPYMEKYVVEALFKMGYPDFALQRLKERFSKMVNHPTYSTLWEGWGIGEEGFGGGTINHGWSGGGLTVLSQYLCGIAPLEPAYKTFQIIPQPGSMRSASATVPSVAGDIKSSFENTADKFSLNTEVPAETTAIIGVPSVFNEIRLNDKLVWKNGKYRDQSLAFIDDDTSYVKFKVQEGKWDFKATGKGD